MHGLDGHGHSGRLQPLEPYGEEAEWLLNLHAASPTHLPALKLQEKVNCEGYLKKMIMSCSN
jgi:hypothetical protein